MAINQQRVNAMKQYLESQGAPPPAPASPRVAEMKKHLAASSHAFNPLNPKSQQNLANITKGTSQSTAGNFAWSLPGAAGQTIFGTAAKTAISLGEIAANPIDTLKGKATGTSYNVPFIGPTRSIQSDAQELFPKIIEGQEPVSKALTGPIFQSVAGPVDSALTFTGAKSLFKGGQKALSSVSTKLAERNATKLAAQADTVAGKIIQGGTDDIRAARNALSDVDVNKVKTYKDLDAELAAKEQRLVDAKGKALSTDQTPRRISELSSKAGDTSHNFVEDALNQLDTFYKKTNNVAEKAKIQALRAKAQKEGLTVKEIDDLAVRHGRDLSGYNANGELASGLTKQAAENTRKGLKTTARDLFGNDAYKAVDGELSHVINTRALVKNMVEQVNKLEQKIIQRSLGAKAGRLVAQVMDFFTGGAFKGFMQTFIPRGEGYKTLNALDLEKQLQKNLKLLQEAAAPGASEATIIQKLQQIIDESGAYEKGGMNYTKIQPQKLEHFSPDPLKSVRVNNYQKPYPSYITADQVSRAGKVADYKKNASKPIDMASKRVRRRYTGMDDIKKPSSPLRYEPVEYPKEIKVKLNRYGKSTRR